MYSTQLDELTVEAYCEALSDLTIEAFVKGCVGISRDPSYLINRMPTPNQIRAHAMLGVAEELNAKASEKVTEKAVGNVRQLPKNKKSVKGKVRKPPVR